jgi:RHS repeat-associated protein
VPGYDAAGNMTTTPEPGDETTGLSCQYDAWDRLAAVYSGSTLVSSYSYDGLNRLIETQSNYVTAGPQLVVYDLYAGQQLIEQRAATFTAGDAAPSADSLDPSYQYVFSANGSNVPILRDTYSGGSLVSGDRIYYLTDANDNVTAIVGLSGGTWQVQERYAYNAYGGVTVYSATWTSPSTTSSYGNTILFAGMNVDTTTGLYHDMGRWYNSSLGTFITTDPAQSTDNLYAYCGNDPIDETDPTGEYYGSDGSWSAPVFLCSEPPAPTCSPKDADMLFTEQAAKKFMAFKYPQDGCYARAFFMARDINMTNAAGKVWAFPSNYPNAGLQVKTAHNPNGSVNWTYHVAPTVQVKGSDGKITTMVIDPSLCSGPVTIDEWKAAMTVPKGTTIVTSQTALGEPPTLPDGKKAKGTGYWVGEDPPGRGATPFCIANSPHFPGVHSRC